LHHDLSVTLNAIFDSIAQQLEVSGFSLIDQFLPFPILDQLREEAVFNFENGTFKRAAIGKGIEKKSVVKIRGDRVKWLDKQLATDSMKHYWSHMDELREYLSNYFRIHLERTEAHFAMYPKGAFYARHVDQFQVSSNRVFSVILYLNPDWKTGDGGELRVYDANGGFSDYSPLHGRLILFRSDLVEHEVLQANLPRVSVTGWMRKDPLLV